MRILHIIATLDPEAGGPTESVRMLLGYKQLGYAGEVVTLDDPGAPFLQGMLFTVHALGPVRTNYGFNLKLVPWLLRNRDRFDGIVVNGLWQICGLSALIALSRRKPYVVFTHGMLDPYFKQTFPLKHIKKWLYWLPVEYWVLRGALRVLFTSNAEKELATQSFWLHRWRAYVVPYGASGPPVDAATAMPSFYAAQPALQCKRFLLFLGRIHRKKGCDLLIEAFAKIAAEAPDLHLVMAGPDQQHWKQHLVEMAARGGIADRVHWPGMLRGDLKWGALYACEAFILPSHQENFGIAVAEALACGKPVLLSNKVNIAGEIESDQVGLVEDDTEAGTLNLLRRWLALSTQEKDAMAKQTTATFNARYDMKENAKAIIRLFEKANRDPLHEKNPGEGYSEGIDR